MSGFDKQVINTINKYKMINPGDKVIVMISGGPDSVSMAHFLRERRNELSIDLSLLHINHQLRGKQSYDDQRFVEELAAKWNAELNVVTVDTSEYCSINNLSLEDGARRIRYEQASLRSNELGGAVIATAHTADDNAETFIMRALRGSGLTGLTGIPPVRGNIIRPFIETFRHNIIKYCSDHQLDYVIDATNLEPAFFRNKVRLQVSPKFDELFPAWKENLLKTTDILRQDLEYMNNVSQSELQNAVSEQHRDLISLEIKKMNDIHPAVRRMVLRKAIEAIAGDLKQIEFKHAELIIDKLSEKGNFSLDLPGDLIAVREYDKLLIKRAERSGQVNETPLAIGSQSHLPEAGISFRMQLIKNNELQYNKNIAYLDQKKIEGQISVRQAKAGDRFNPLGVKGSKKLSDYFTDKKIPRRLREKALVVADSSKILWIVGFEISDLAKVDPDTDRILEIRRYESES